MVSPYLLTIISYSLSIYYRLFALDYFECNAWSASPLTGPPWTNCGTIGCC